MRHFFMRIWIRNAGKQQHPSFSFLVEVALFWITNLSYNNVMAAINMTAYYFLCFVQPDGVNVKYVPEHGPLSTWCKIQAEMANA